MPKEIQAESNTYRKLSNNIKAIYNELEPLYINNKIKNYNDYYLLFIKKDSLF